MSRNLGSIITAIAFMLLVTACGGDKETAATASPNSASSPAAVATSASPAAGSGNTPALSSGFCGDWRTLATQSAALAAPAGPSSGLKENFEATSAYMKALADKAPPEVKSDFQVYAKFWSDYAAVMAKANYDMTKAATDPELQKALQSMSDPKLQQASVNIATWIQSNCVSGR